MNIILRAFGLWNLVSKVVVSAPCYNLQTCYQCGVACQDNEIFGISQSDCISYIDQTSIHVAEYHPSETKCVLGSCTGIVYKTPINILGYTENLDVRSFRYSCVTDCPVFELKEKWEQIKDSPTDTHASVSRSDCITMCFDTAYCYMWDHSNSVCYMHADCGPTVSCSTNSFSISYRTYTRTCLSSCGDPLTPANGNVTFTDTITDSVASFSCNDGFVEATGSNTQTCQSDGVWSSPQPVCEASGSLTSTSTPSTTPTVTSTTTSTTPAVTSTTTFTTPAVTSTMKSTTSTVTSTITSTTPAVTSTMRSTTVTSTTTPTTSTSRTSTSSPSTSVVSTSPTNQFTMSPTLATNLATTSVTTTTVSPSTSALSTSSTNQATTSSTSSTNAATTSLRTTTVPPSTSALSTSSTNPAVTSLTSSTPQTSTPQMVSSNTNSAYARTESKSLEQIYIMSCLCYGNKTFTGKTDEEIIKMLIEDTKINTKSTTLAKNKVISRGDLRPSSKAIGFAGLGFIILVFGSIIVSDAVVVVLKLKELIVNFTV